MEELEEALNEILPSGFSIETDSHGQIIIFTGLAQEDDGELVDFEGDDEDEESDPDFESLEDDDEEDD